MKGSLIWVAAMMAGPALADPSAADLGQALTMAISADGGVENMCGSNVTATVTPIDFGGALGAAFLLLIPNGNDTPTCYGDFPGDMYLMAAEGKSWRMVFAGGGFITVLPTGHGGVHDFALGGPGFSFPVYAWNGAEFAVSGEISDEKLSALGALPSYP